MKQESKASITSFFLLTIIFTLPAYVLITLTGLNIILSPEMVFSLIPLSVIAPICAALVLTYRKDGWIGVKKLLKRSFDYKRVINKKWYWPTLLLMPLFFSLVLGVSYLFDQELAAAQMPLIAAPIAFILFFFTALTEQVGWMGYAFEPMRNRWGLIKSTLLLGLIWGLWHIPLYIFLFPNAEMLIVQVLGVIALRVLLVWLYSNTGKSVFIVILFHATYDVCMSVFPVNFVVTAIIMSISVALILYFWSRNQKTAVTPIA
jgi:membrane protease YdiL (CAAX protease family)